MQKEIVIVGLSHHNAPIEVRESLAFENAYIKAALAELRAYPSIQEGVIVSTCNRVEIVAATADAQSACADIRRFHGRPGSSEDPGQSRRTYVRLSRPRRDSPSFCEFDLPAYHYWLNRSADERRRDLGSWIEPFAPIAAGIGIVLRLLRENGRASRHTAHHGVFQLMLTTTKVAQLLRIALAREIPCVPEISANKYALNIRFIGVSGMARGAVFGGDVDFELMFCNL